MRRMKIGEIILDVIMILFLAGCIVYMYIDAVARGVQL